MSAARNIPFENALTAQNIAIDSTFTPNPQGVIIGIGQQVTFTNNSGATIQLIHFNANPPQAPSGPGPTLFTDITNLGSGQTSPAQTPNPTGGSVNYLITDNHGNQHGPFSIQAGVAVPLKIQIIAGVIYPATAAVPVRGLAAIYSDDSPCNQYPITWTSGNPFTAATPTAACGFSNTAIRTATNTTGNYNFGVPTSTATGPGGKIVIQN